MSTRLRLASSLLSSLAFGLGLAVVSGTAASAACKPAPHFTLKQKDGFTVDFATSGRSAGAHTPQYGSANATVKIYNGGTKLVYRVYWSHGEVGVYTIRVRDDNFGTGTVTTPDRNVSPVSFVSLGPVVTGC